MPVNKRYQGVAFDILQEGRVRIAIEHKYKTNDKAIMTDLFTKLKAQGLTSNEVTTEGITLFTIKLEKMQ